MTLRKGQKLINYLRKRFHNAPSIAAQDGTIRRVIFNMSDSELDMIISMSDKDCYEKYGNNQFALSDKLLKQIFTDDDIRSMKEINKNILEDKEK